MYILKIKYTVFGGSNSDNNNQENTSNSSINNNQENTSNSSINNNQENTKNEDKLKSSSSTSSTSEKKKKKFDVKEWYRNKLKKKKENQQDTSTINNSSSTTSSNTTSNEDNEQSHSTSSSTATSSENLIRINLDGKATGHIKAIVQMIVLNYPYNESYPDGVRIAVAVQDRSKPTQSSRFCPLIWRALHKCDKFNIPKDLFESYRASHSVVDRYTDELSQIPGWCDYAYSVLTHEFNNIPKGSAVFGNPFVIEQSKYFYEKNN